MEMRNVFIVGRGLSGRVCLGAKCRSRRTFGLGQVSRAFSTTQTTWASGFAESQSKKASAHKVEADTEKFRTHSVQDLLSLKGRVTVVTGGARGIGLALARGTAELGSDVAVLDILEKPSDAFLDFQKDLGVRAKYYRTSVTNPATLSQTFEQVIADFGRIDNCVTAAGIAVDKPFLETTAEEGMKVLDVNVMGTYLSAQLAAKQMQAQNSGGSIVMVASVAARAALPSQHLSIYGASKGAVKGLCRQLSVELSPSNIRVNTISPGYISTEMTNRLAATNPTLLSVFNSAAPLQRIGDRADLKTVVAYLCSDAAAYTTGTDILVTGGLHAGRL